MNIVLIGAGNVATHLGPLLKKSGHRIVQLYSRTKSGQLLAKKLKCSHTTNASQIFTSADAYILALTDEGIAAFPGKINFIPSLILHTSGSTGLDVFPKKFKNTGVLYPLQTFSKTNIKTPEVIPFCIEGNNSRSLATIRKIAKSISPVVVELNSDKRRAVHMSAVFVNNFTNHLFTMAEKILRSNKIPFDILRPLILETAAKVQSNSPREMQTGPAMRGDKSTINKHLKLLKKIPELKVIYRTFTKSITKEKGYE